MNKLAAFTLMAFLALPHAASAELSGVFGGSESSSLRPFPKWTRVMAKHPKDEAAATDRITKWQAFLKTLEGKSRSEQIKAVNTKMNASPYVTDIVNWGVQDYWETPLEFMRRRGDCEDYAIAKFYSLRRLGFDNKDMRIVILMDRNINTLHSVLVVKDGDELKVLDNQISKVADAAKVHHYQPIYSVNEKSWWRYQ